MYVELSHVTFAHGGAEPILVDVCQRFVPGITAIVGANGAGKSTLLALVGGAVAAQQGRVHVEPRDARLLLCEQGVERLGARVERFAAGRERAARRLRGRLELDALAVERWPTLSPGERRRFQVGAALAEEPDVLLLDEPTNHVDEAARLLIAAALQDFRGVCLLVSHDRALIDALAVQTVRIERGALSAVNGGYSRARAVWQHERADALARRRAAVREVDKANRKLHDARRVQASAERGRSAHARLRNAGDSDGRTLAARTLADWAEAKASRSVAVRRDRLAARKATLAAAWVDKELGRSVLARYAPCPRRRLAALEVAELARGEHVVLRDLHVAVERDARIRITGRNGAGKSTLLAALHAALPDRERVLYLPQELTTAAAHEWLERTRALPRSERGQVLEIVAALGTPPERLLGSTVLSAGEARKLVLAHGLARSAWALLLDEPTNHLDLPSVERLEAALASYPGALVVVTHDSTFLADALKVTWALGACTLTID